MAQIFKTDTEMPTLSLSRLGTNYLCKTDYLLIVIEVDISKFHDL